jgi:hypothetical protein
MAARASSIQPCGRAFSIMAPNDCCQAASSQCGLRDPGGVGIGELGGARERPANGVDVTPLALDHELEGAEIVAVFQGDAAIRG